MNKFIVLLAGWIVLTACDNDDPATSVKFEKDTLELTSHSLAAWTALDNSKYLLVFESGMGDSHQVWIDAGTAPTLAKETDVVIYDRAGYGKSTIDSQPRSIDRLRQDLEVVVDRYAEGRKVILVGHSLGGYVIRDYAIKNPDNVAALFFIDPSHEGYQDASRQDLENLLYETFSSNFGANSGAAREASQIIEDIVYAATLPHLPNVPVTVLTSMAEDDNNKFSDEAWGKTREDWYAAHESLKEGVSDFTHIGTTRSGHYIMKDESGLVKRELQKLISKLN